MINLRPDEIKLSIHRSQLGNVQPWDVFHKLVMAITGVLLKGSYQWSTKETLDPGRHGFEHRCTLYWEERYELASFEWGGFAQAGWCLLHIHGGLCKLLKPCHYKALYGIARLLKARLGAIDIAGDDQDGALGIHPAAVRAAHQENPRAFMPVHLVKGQAPKFAAWMEGSPRRGGPVGCTLYLGGSRSSVRHRIYEKGKEQNDKLHENWHRWEVMFRRTDKTELNLKLLLPATWRKAWLGSCKWLQQKFQESGLQMTNKIEKARRTAQEKAAKVVVQLERQYGGAIGHLVRVMGAEGFLDAVQRPAPSSMLACLTSEDLGEIYQLIGDDRLHKPGMAALDRVQTLWASALKDQDNAWWSPDSDLPWYQLGLVSECLEGLTAVDFEAAAVYAGLRLRETKDLFGSSFYQAQAGL